MSAGAATGTIKTKIPSRLDRLPWSRFHWMVVLGLGTVWILDGLEVTNVGNVSARMEQAGSGITISAGQIGLAGSLYVVGAVLGALLFGQLTDRFGRKRLFMITLGIYIVATTATAFSFAPWFYFVCRVVTGAGIGGEYSSINSAIDELIPARARGRIDLAINGSYWLGAIIGSAAALLFLDKSIFAVDFGWRLSFGVGAVIGLSVLLVRRNVPESPRWLFIHGREQEAEAIVDGIERSVRKQTDQPLSEPESVITVRQRERIPFSAIASVAFKRYPKRAILGLALFIGQAFLYNGVTFNIGTLFTNFEHVGSGAVPIFTIVYAAGNFAGPLLLGRLFDTVGRKPMISATYIGSAVVAGVMGILFTNGVLGTWGLEGMICATFFLASAGASAAYLTVSEIFPMETRALAIAFFYAVGTGLGGIIGPILFSHLFASKHLGDVALAFWIGAAVMALGGIAELLLGVRAERASLESIAAPLTAVDGEEASGEAGAGERLEALRLYERAEEAHAWAAEHRARQHELRAGGANENGSGVHAEQVLAEVDELRARALEERAKAQEERASAAEAEPEVERDAALERASAAEERARAHEEHAASLAAEDDSQADRHRRLAEAAAERARADEQRARADEAQGEAEQHQGARVQMDRARAQVHEAWAAMHDQRALAAERRAEGDERAGAEHEREAHAHEELALAAEERVQAAEHRVAAEEVQGGEEEREAGARRLAEAAQRDRRARELEDAIRQRLIAREQRERAGLRRFRPGPGSAFYSPGLVRTADPVRRSYEEEALDHEVRAIARALAERGPTERDELAKLLGARYWGPGRYGQALREAVAEGAARRLSLRTYGPGHRRSASGEDPDGGAGGDGHAREDAQEHDR